ncbi:MAG: cytochrome c biogenesis protein CcsA [Bacteroidetes bacterium]|nr:cytochrome c biogenesis protein CcsA [Bacteroidota bacterium]
MIGNILLTLGMLAGAFTVLMYFMTYKGYENTLKFARIGYHTMAIMVIASSALLLHAILTHQYQYKYIYNYSGSDLPTGLLMSTFYAGQEGSFMLWLFFTAIVGLILLEYTSKRGDLEQRVMMIFSLAATFLLIMVSPMLKNPFAYIWADPTFIEIKSIKQSLLSAPFLQNFLFEDAGGGKTFVKMNSELFGILKSQGIAVNDFIVQGKGLNPLLQNFWMQIHPPILFVGFSMSTVPFAFAFAALLKNEYNNWIKQALPWVLSGTMVLGLAIMLGGYWAYGVLGWGGYWGWDPVENSSLVPWIIGVASIHTMLVQRKTQAKDGIGRFGKTNLILCIMTYLLVLYSTFLTRSGILGDASVHSFVDPGMTVYLLLISLVGIFTILGFGAIAYRWKYLNEHFNFEDNLLSRELALFTGSVALIAAAIIVLVGTSAPIFGQSVEVRFYNELNLPIGIIIGFLNGFSLLLKWKHTNKKDFLKQARFSMISAFVLTILIAVFGGVTDIMLIIFTLSASFTLFVNLEIAYKIFMGRKSFLGAYVAHIGIALFMLGVIASGSFSETKQIQLTKGEKVNVLGYDLTFTGFNLIENGQKYAFNIEVADGSDKSVVAPVMYIAEFNNSLMREPDILNLITKDFYVAPVSYEDGSGHNSNAGTNVTLSRGESYEFNGAKIIFDKFNFPPDAMSSMMSGGDFRIGAEITLEYKGKYVQLEPAMKNSGGQRSFEAVEFKDANLKIEMSNLDASGKVSLVLSNLDGVQNGQLSSPKEILSIDASVKPFINLVWAGVLVMVAGFIISAFRRSKESLVIDN